MTEESKMTEMSKKTEEINGETIGYINSVETFGLVDGPGVRYVIFMQGCHMRCKYCHNPETWAMKTGNQVTASQALEKALRYKKYWGKNGGLTVSGGEPLLQMDFMIELFRLAKKKGVHTTLDTAGNPYTEKEPFASKFKELMEYTDLVMLDFKEFDSKKHKELTGFGNENIAAMARWLSDNGKDMWIRHVLVPGLTDDTEGLENMSKFISELKTVRRVEVLPYHTLGLFKWENLKIPYPLEGVMTPKEDEVRRAEKILKVKDYN